MPFRGLFFLDRPIAAPVIALYQEWVLLPSKYGTEGVAELTQGRKEKSFALTPTRVAKVGRPRS